MRRLLPGLEMRVDVLIRGWLAEGWLSLVRICWVPSRIPWNDSAWDGQVMFHFHPFHCKLAYVVLLVLITPTTATQGTLHFSYTTHEPMNSRSPHKFMG